MGSNLQDFFCESGLSRVIVIGLSWDSLWADLRDSGLFLGGKTNTPSLSLSDLLEEEEKERPFSLRLDMKIPPSVTPGIYDQQGAV